METFRPYVGVSGVDQGASIPDGPKDPVLQFSLPMGVVVQSGTFANIATVPCKGFSAFVVRLRSQTIPVTTNFTSATAAYRIYALSLGQKSPQVYDFIGADFGTAEHFINGACDTLIIDAALKFNAAIGFLPVRVWLSVEGIP